MAHLKINIESSWPSYKFLYSWGEQTFNHEVHVPDDCFPSDDALFRVAVLSRPANCEYIKVGGVKPANMTVNFFQKHTKSLIEVEALDDIVFENRIRLLGNGKVNLCFSGGFDSIAALAVLGEGNVNLISNDFGSKFKRESDFFRTFDPKIFRWNLRGARSRESYVFNESVDWRFMVSTPILYQHQEAQMFVGTGTILESGPFWYSEKPRPDFLRYSPYGLGPGIAMVNPVACLSEYATTKIAIDFLGNQMVDRSLESLAPSGSFKRYRKEVLMAIVRGEQVPSKNSSLVLHKFGKGFGDDVIAMYLVWKLGFDWVKSNYCSDVPENSKYLDMSFFELFNSNNLKVFDEKFRNSLTCSFSAFGINPYGEHDVKRLGVSKLLRENTLQAGA